MPRQEKERGAASSDRFRRLMRLIHIIQAERPFDAPTLAHELGVSRRTLFRDLQVLDHAGLPTRFDKKAHRYAIEQARFLPPVDLTLGEALALLLVTRKFVHRRMMPAHRLAVSAATKIEALLPPHVREHCGLLLNEVDVRLWPTSDAQAAADALTTLQTCLAQRRKVRLSYDSYFDGGTIDLVLRPYRVLFARRGWYVIGYSEKHQQVRMFKIERTRSLQVLDPTYTIDRSFNLDDYLGNAWQLVRGDRRYHVVVRFLPKVAGNVEEVNWHKTQQTRRDGDGSMLFDVEVDGIDEISWWILGYGDQAQVLEPPELRDLIASRARAMLAYYEARQPDRMKG